MIERKSPRPLLLTMGEPGGIGPDLALQLWANRNEISVPPFAVLGDPAFFESRSGKLGLSTPVEVIEESALAAARDKFADAFPVFNIGASVSDNPGLTEAANGQAVINAIERAVGLVCEGKAGAVITNPIQKSSLYEAGFRHPGHTEFLGELGSQWSGRPCKPVMMLAGPELRTVPATVHIPIKDVPTALTSDALIEIVEITHEELRSKFSISHPRIVVTGLNPHAGENDTMGVEDSQIIAPAIASARAKGMDVTGPHPADTLFYAARRTTYDAAIAMYHDQALLPVKTIAFDETVNVTLGLPFIRTSPDHGTALDIAGRGVARPDSLLAAIRMADEMARNFGHEA